MDISILSNYFIVVIVGICCSLGYVIKNSFDFIPNKYIPAIMAVIGVVLNVWMNGSITPDVILGGLFSGLSSVGLHQSYKQIIENKKQ